MTTRASARPVRKSAPAQPHRETSAPAAKPTVAVAFGGGGARGLAHVHVIEELDALGVRPVVIAGSSIGAIMGAAMAAGMSGADIRAYVTSVLKDKTQVAGRMWSARPSSFSEMMSGGFRLAQFDVLRILKAFLPDALPHDFEDLAIPLKVTATDYFGHREHVFEHGDLRKAVAASAAIPALFKPVHHDGKTLIDGGIYNPVPFDLLGGLADIVIAVDVVGGPEVNDRRSPSSIDYMFGATQLMMQSIIAMKLKAHPPAILLKPNVSKFRVLDFLKYERVLEASEPVRDDLRMALAPLLEKQPA